METPKEFKVGHLIGGRLVRGHLSVSESGLEWNPEKEKKGEKVLISSDDIKSMEWYRCSQMYELRTLLVLGGSVRFQGLKESDFPPLSELCKKLFNTEIQKVELNSSGQNWGALEIDGDDVKFVSKNALTFGLSLSETSQSLLQTKTEVSLEFNKQLPETGRSSHHLSEVRFYVPANAGIGGTADKETGEVECGPDVFHHLVVEKAGLEATGDVLCSFDKMKMIVPRGNVKMDLCKNFMRIQGRSHQHTVLYSMIQKMFFLQPEDDKKEGIAYFVMMVSPPIRQGKSSYPTLLFEFDIALFVEDNDPIKINLTPSEIEEQYPDGKIQNSMVGTFWEVFVSVVKALTGRKVIGSGSFRTSSRSHAIECSYKNIRGFLFPLERSFLFLRSPLFFTHKEITSVKVERGGPTSAGKMFEVTFEKEQMPLTVTFNSIERKHEEFLVKWFLLKGLNVVREDKARETVEADVLGEESGEESDEEDDADYEGGASSDSDYAELVEEKNPVTTEEVEKPQKRRKRAAAKKKS